MISFNATRVILAAVAVTIFTVATSGWAGMPPTNSESRTDDVVKRPLSSGLNLTVKSVTNGSQLDISWNGNLGMKYKVCWKVANTGDACASGSHQLTVTPTAGGGNWSSGVAYVRVPSVIA